MKKIIILYISFYLLATASFYSCKRYETKSLNNKDSVLIVNEALDHVLKQYILPKEYYNQPLQLIKPKGFKFDVEIIVNGKKCIILPESTQAKDILNKMDIYKPLPLTEVMELKLHNEVINIEIIFRSTGHCFQLKMKKNNTGGFHVVEMKDITI